MTPSKVKKTKKNRNKKERWTGRPVEAARLCRLPLYVGIGFALVSWLLLVLFESDLLFRVQELSLFLPTRLYFEQLMVVPGGFLSYAGSFLCQFFYYPALGALLLVISWTAVYAAVYATFRISPRWALLALIPVFALVASDLELGYWLFHIKIKGYYFYNTLGFLSAVGAIAAFRALPAGCRYPFVLVWALLGYPLLGVYAVWGGIGVAAAALCLPERKNRKISLCALALLSVISAPLLWYHLYNQINLIYLYTAGLPNFEWLPAAYYLWIPFALLFLTLSIYPFFKKEETLSGVPHAGRYLCKQLILLTVMISAVQFFWYRDTNFRAEMKMNAAMEEFKWQKVLDVAKAGTGTPTRLMVMNKNLALIKLGRLGNEMFRYPDGGEPPVCPFEIHLMQVGGKMLYYHYAKFNFCYRWCLEDGVEYGWKVDYLKYLVKCSLLSGEYAAAQKFLNTLKKTLFYNDWARKYEKFVNRPDLIAKDKEFASILPLYCYDNQLDGDNTLVEIYLLNFFSKNSSERNTRMYDEVAMMAALTLKDIPTFWSCFFRYAESHKDRPMPIHYQEAALLYGNLEKKVDISKMPFDKAVSQKFQRFMSFTQNNQGRSEEELKPYYYPEFGDTFYFFYFFVRNVKSY